MALVGWLKQSTAATITIGPFTDATDGVTAETALTLSQADIRLSKNDGTFAQKNQSSTATHKENGYYTCSLDTTDSNTLGLLTVAINESGAGPVRQDYLVVPANVYDSIVANTNALNINVYAVGGLTANADNLAAVCAGTVRGTTTNAGFTGTSTEFEASDITEATAGHYIGRVVTFNSGALLGQSTVVQNYSLSGGGRGHFTVVALTEVVPSGITFTLT